MTRKREAFKPTDKQRELSKLCMMTLSNSVEAILEELGDDSLGKVEFMSLATRDIMLLLFEYNNQLVEQHIGEPVEKPEQFIEILSGQLKRHLSRKDEEAPNGL